jgi:hypothetical protein
LQKLVLMSVLIATFAVPAAVRRESEHLYRRALGPFAVFTAVYVLLLLFVYPRLA